MTPRDVKTLVTLEAVRLRGKNGMPASSYVLVGYLAFLQLAGLAFGWTIGTRTTIAVLEATKARNAAVAGVVVCLLALVAGLRFVDLWEVRRNDVYGTCAALGTETGRLFGLFHASRVWPQLYLPLLVFGIVVTFRRPPLTALSVAQGIAFLEGCFVFYCLGFALAANRRLARFGQATTMFRGRRLTVMLVVVAIEVASIVRPAIAPWCVLALAVIGSMAAWDCRRVQRAPGALLLLVPRPGDGVPTGGARAVAFTRPSRMSGAVSWSFLVIGAALVLGGSLIATEAMTGPVFVQFWGGLTVVTALLAVAIAGAEGRSATPVFLWWRSGKEIWGWFARKYGIVLAGLALPPLVVMYVSPSGQRAFPGFLVAVASSGAFAMEWAARHTFGRASSNGALEWLGLGSLLAKGGIVCGAAAVAVLGCVLMQREVWFAFAAAAAWCMTPWLLLRRLPHSNPRLV